jgi:hypothetical protein
MTTQAFTSHIYAQPVTITMEIDYGLWTGTNPDWYNAVSFRDSSPNDANRAPQDRKGLFFRTKVRRNQNLTWTSAWSDGTAPPEGTRVILISVARRPSNAGAFLLDKSWYNSSDNGNTIEGRIRGVFEDGELERYIISFAIYHNDGTYDIYTIDPILQGHQ